LRFALSRVNHHTVGSNRLPLEAMLYAMWTLPSGVRTKFAFFEKFMPKIEPVLRQLFRAKYFQA